MNEEEIKKAREIIAAATLLENPLSLKMRQRDFYYAARTGWPEALDEVENLTLSVRAHFKSTHEKNNRINAYLNDIKTFTHQNLELTKIAILIEKYLMDGDNLTEIREALTNWRMSTMHKFVPFNQDLGPRIIDSAAVELSASNYILHSKLNSYLEDGSITQEIYDNLMKSVNTNSKEIETLILALPGNEKARHEKYAKDNI